MDGFKISDAEQDLNKIIIPSQFLPSLPSNILFTFTATDDRAEEYSYTHAFNLRLPSDNALEILSIYNNCNGLLMPK